MTGKPSDPARGLMQVPPAGTYRPAAAPAPEPEFAEGSVRAYRWWTLPAPPLDRNPAHADEVWPRALLRGAQDEWQPGVSTAECRQRNRHDPDDVPALMCECGFWATWHPQWCLLPVARGRISVFGVIKGWSRPGVPVRIGSESVRVGKARIVALHLPWTLGLIWPRKPPDGPVPSTSLGQALARNARFTGRIVNFPGSGSPAHWADHPGPWFDTGEPYEREPTAAEIAVAEANAEGWMAVIGDRLAQMYPGTEICETRDLLLAKYPPDANYALVA